LRILNSVKRAAHDLFEFNIQGQVIMRGSSGIPKSDINSTSAPTTTADTNAALQNTTESNKRQKTRKPPLVKGRHPAYLQNSDSKTSKVSGPPKMSKGSSTKEGVSPLSTQIMNQHTAPAISSSGKKSQVRSEANSHANDRKEIALSLALRIQPALVERDLDQLEIVMKGMEGNNLRFDSPPLVNYREIKEFMRTGTLKIIALANDAVTDQAEDLLIRMIRLGCNVNVVDQLGNSLLIRACKAGRFALVKVLLTECPDIRKDWLNVHGQNAAMMAYKYGNSQLYTLLEQSGISPHPENPAINRYLSSFEISDHDSTESTESESEDYSELFKENNFMNLADVNGQTLLFHAVIHEDVDFVSFLCQQEKFPNLALRDKNQKSVFDYIKQIKDPEKKKNISQIAYNLALQTGSLQQLAKYTYSDGVLKKE